MPAAYTPPMRLTDKQRSTLVDTTRRHFGSGARLWVFGSRTDDTARGGDFDLMVWCDEASAENLFEAKLAMLADLHHTPEFDSERIDVVLFSPRLDAVARPVQRAAMEQGVELAL